MTLSKRKYKLKKKRSKKKNMIGGSINIGIVITIYKRYSYLKLLLKSLEKCKLDNIFICFVDDFSNDTNITNLLLNFCKSRNCFIINNKKNMGLFTSLKIGLENIKDKCDYMCNLDSDVIVKKNWIQDLYDVYNNYSEQYNTNKFLVSGFNCLKTCWHNKIVSESDNYIIKNSIGGVNMFYHKSLYNEIIKSCLNNISWDWCVVNKMHVNNYPILITKPSVIQHIGFNGVNSTKVCDIAEDFEDYSIHKYQTIIEKLKNDGISEKDIYSNLYSSIVHSKILGSDLSNNLRATIFSKYLPKYKYGILITTYNRSDLLRKFFNKLFKTNLDDTFIYIIDDVSTDPNTVNQLIKIKELNKDNIRVDLNKNKKKIQENLLFGFDYLKSFCKYLTNFDPDLLINKNWTKKFDETISYLDNDKWIVTGFNEKNHLAKHLTTDMGKYRFKKCGGGINYCFSTESYNNYLRDIFVDLSNNQKSYSWDQHFVDIIAKSDYNIYGTKPSVIQHIGVNGLNNNKNLQFYMYSPDYNPDKEDIPVLKELNIPYEP